MEGKFWESVLKNLILCVINNKNNRGKRAWDKLHVVELVRIRVPFNKPFFFLQDWLVIVLLCPNSTAAIKY